MIFRQPYNNYFSDMKNSIECYEERYSKEPKKAALRILFWNALFLFIPRKQLKEKINSRNVNKLSIGFILAGGYGDYLLFANWLDYFMKRFCIDNKVEIFLLYHIKNALTIFNYPIKHLTLVDSKECAYDKFDFDVTFKFCVLPELVYCNHKKVKSMFPLLSDYINACVLFREENALIFEKRPSLDGMGSSRAIVQGIKRIQEPDIYGLLKIREEYRFKIRIEGDEKQYLESVGLRGKRFITIHRGWDGTISNNVKAWSVRSCHNLIPALKQNFCDYKIVLIGSDRAQAPQNLTNCDLNLIEKTSLDQVKILLKHATIHIDNEGGMVHLRHALHGGSSVVLFGPTSKELFGYSENINLKSDVCPLFCEWLTNDWPVRCPRSKEGVPCMDGIHTYEIIEACKKIILETKEKR